MGLSVRIITRAVDRLSKTRLKGDKADDAKVTRRGRVGWN